MPGKEEGYIDVLEKGYRDGMGRGLVKRSEGGEVLKKGFVRGGGEEDADVKVFSAASVSAKGKGGNSDGSTWEERATEWQLEVERWVIEDSSAGEMAKRAFVSHVRAYATHVAKERGFFDVKELHLGHLAKAFALRDRPGNMGRGVAADVAKRSSQGVASKKRMLDNSRDGESGDTWTRNETDPHAPVQNAGKKMMSKMKEHMAAAGEFNIG